MTVLTHGGCRHAQLPTFLDDGSIAHYKCCGLRTPRCTVTPPVLHQHAGGGCMAIDHAIDAAGDTQSVDSLQMLQRHRDDICFVGAPRGLVSHNTDARGGNNGAYEHVRVSVFWEEESAVGVSVNAAQVLFLRMHLHFAQVSVSMWSTPAFRGFDAQDSHLVNV